MSFKVQFPLTSRVSRSVPAGCVTIQPSGRWAMKQRDVSEQNLFRLHQESHGSDCLSYHSFKVVPFQPNISMVFAFYCPGVSRIFLFQCWQATTAFFYWLLDDSKICISNIRPGTISLTLDMSKSKINRITSRSSYQSKSLRHTAWTFSQCVPESGGRSQTNFTVETVGNKHMKGIILFIRACSALKCTHVCNYELYN